MKILAFLQNQWFKNPARVKEMYERHPDLRNQYIARFLFMGCLTGRRLQSALGTELCEQIIWEETSKEIGGFSASVFPADHDHIRNAIETHLPDVVLCFGKIAGDGVRAVCCELKVRHPAVMFAPHPAARDNPVPAIKALRESLLA
jgi:hypothetical protein